MESRPRLVILGRADEPPPGVEEAEPLARLDYATTTDDLVAAIDGAPAVFAWDYEPDLLPSAWDRAGGVRWIQAASAGVDRLLFPELVESDVVVTTARGVFDRTIAEYVTGLIIAFAKDFPMTFEHTRAGVWEHRDTHPVHGADLLVVGVGPIGRAIAAAARALGMRVRGVGRTGRSRDPDFGEVLPVEQLAESLAGADYVVNALPATTETRHRFDADEFEAMKATAVFLNIGRGATVDEPALIDALADGRIGGAALDVFEQEPLPPDSPLWRLPNVIVSPHMAGDFHGWDGAIVEIFLDNLRRFVRGAPLRNVVDKRLGYVAHEVAEPAERR